MQTNVINGIISITDQEFRLISGLVYDKFGIKLGEHKKTLVEGRLNKLIKQLGFHNFMDYYDHVIHDNTANSLILLIDRISTNHTFFYREKSHFVFLKENVLPELVIRSRKERRNDIRIWSAGCASGEESYTISMVLNDFFGADIRNWDIGILATDISVSALFQAGQGIYPIDRIKELPADYRSRYINKIDEQTVEVKDIIRENILFKRLNFMNKSYPFKGRFDIIFCRNVMIYFDGQTRKSLVERLGNYIRGGGYLFIGHSESLGRDNSSLHYVIPAVYKKLEG